MRRALAVILLALVAGCGDADPPPGIRIADHTVHSRAVGRDMDVKVVLPAGDARGRPLLVFLHGRGGDEDSYVHRPFLDALQALGTRAPIVAFPDGAEDKYWHDRASGAWGRYVADEVIPQVVRRFGADRRRVAIGGISMGGFGAYDLAEREPGRFCAVGGHSPALWRTGGQTAPGAFDDADDFARHDVIANAGKLARTSVWLDTGDEDPFRPGDEAFAAAAPNATVHVWPGGHDSDYWNAHWDEYLRFYARELRRC